MFNIRFDNFLDKFAPLTNAIREACEEMERRSQLAHQYKRPETRDAAKDWFGDSDNSDLWANVTRLDEVIRDTRRTVTFVNAVGKVVRVRYDPNDITQAPVELSQPPTAEEMRGAFAWAYPTPGDGATQAGQTNSGTPLFHHGSGMRLYLGYQTLCAAPIDYKELMATIYHELSHKVIGTNDLAYGRDQSKALIAGGRALENADNYAFFLLSLA